MTGLGAVLTGVAAGLTTYGLATATWWAAAVGAATWLFIGFMPAHLPETHARIAVPMWLATVLGAAVSLAMVVP